MQLLGDGKIDRSLINRPYIGSLINSLILFSEDDVCNEFSCLFLAHMSSDFTSKLNIYKCDGIEPLLNLLASPDPDVQKNSVEAISNLVLVGTLLP